MVFVREWRIKEWLEIFHCKMIVGLEIIGPTNDAESLEGEGEREKKRNTNEAIALERFIRLPSRTHPIQFHPNNKLGIKSCVVERISKLDKLTPEVRNVYRLLIMSCCQNIVQIRCKKKLIIRTSSGKNIRFQRLNCQKYPFCGSDSPSSIYRHHAPAFVRFCEVSPFPRRSFVLNL